VTKGYELNHCLLHEVGKECPLVGPDRHCGKKRCRIDSVNPFREEAKK